MSKEAIALLEKAKKALHYQSTGFDYIDQALAILKQPKDQPTEFTKKCKAMAEVFLESTEKLTEKKLTALLDSNWNGVGFIMRIFGDLLEGRLAAKEALEICDRLDESEASRKELLEACKAVKIRIHFIGLPSEPMNKNGTDWSKEIALLEAAIAKAEKEQS